MGRLGWLSAVVAIGTFLLAYFEFMAPDNEWRHRASGFVAGCVIAGIIGVLAFFSYRREFKREKKLAKLDLIQMVPAGSPSWGELCANQHHLEHDKQSAEDELQIFVSQSQRAPYRLVPDWQLHEEAKIAKQAQLDVGYYKAELDRFNAEIDRVESLTDKEWASEQVARIYLAK